MYKILPSALSLMSDREWKEATMPGECSQVEEKKKVQMEYFKKVRGKVSFCEE